MELSKLDIISPWSVVESMDCRIYRHFPAFLWSILHGTYSYWFGAAELCHHCNILYPWSFSLQHYILFCNTLLVSFPMCLFLNTVFMYRRHRFWNWTAHFCFLPSIILSINFNYSLLWTINKDTWLSSIG